MKLNKHFLLLLVPAMLFACTPANQPSTPDDPDDPNKEQPENPTPSTPEPEDEVELAPEIHDGDVVLASNYYVDKFIKEVNYPTHDYSTTELLTWAETNGVKVCPGTNTDKPSEYTIRWTKDPKGGDVTVTVSEPTRDWKYSGDLADGYVTIYNLLPNTKYTYVAKTEDGKELTKGSFSTTGQLHQLFFRSRIRNCRDLGGWKTENGKTVKYRMVYRGGRLEPSYLSKIGKAEIKTEGILAELDLRGKSDVFTAPALDYLDFCAPVIEEGYSQMLKSDKEKTRQCMQFIMDCVKNNKPVYFHCSLGRDRTGTVAMLTLGILGVPEGDISKEYEITQFAPHGYATSEGEKSKMTRRVDYKGAANVIWDSYANGGTFQEGVNNYLLEIGISQEDINLFQKNMLE